MGRAAIVLEQGRVRAGLSFEQLWVRYFALGGMATVTEIRAFLMGNPQPNAEQYGLIAHALNELLDDMKFEEVPFSTPDV